MRCTYAAQFMVAAFPSAQYFHSSAGREHCMNANALHGWLEEHRAGMHHAACELADAQPEASSVSPSLQSLVSVPTLHERSCISTGSGDRPLCSSRCRAQSISSALSTALAAASAHGISVVACLLGSKVQAGIKFCMERDVAATAEVFGTYAEIPQE